MDNIFAKAPSTQAHNYTKLLTRKQLHLITPENCFAKSVAKERRLYTPRGMNKGHRRTCSIPTEEPQEAQTVPQYALNVFSGCNARTAPLYECSPDSLESQMRSLQLTNLGLERTNHNLACEVARLRKLLETEERVVDI